jgi:hypothetical protein
MDLISRKLSILFFLPAVGAMLSGCSPTFDERGNFRDPTALVGGEKYRLIDESNALFIAERTVQLWSPSVDEEIVSGTFASQAALISSDGYALATSHGLDAGDVFTFHQSAPPYQPLQVKKWDATGIYCRNLDGTETIIPVVDLIPTRVVHRFEHLDLAIIHTGLRDHKFFNLASSPPVSDETVQYGFNRLVHPDLRGLTAQFIEITHETDSGWKFETTGASNYGDSGSAAINEQRELVGCVTAGIFSKIPWGKNKRMLRVQIEGVASDPILEILTRDRLQQIRAKADLPPRRQMRRVLIEKPKQPDPKAPAGHPAPNVLERTKTPVSP